MYAHSNSILSCPCLLLQRRPLLAPRAQSTGLNIGYTHIALSVLYCLRLETYNQLCGSMVDVPKTILFYTVHY